jgi:Ala-tRNA(Pro) deacylase
LCRVYTSEGLGEGLSREEATMDIKEYLKKEKVKFTTTVHKEAFTAQEVAASEHVKGKYFAKTVVIKAGDEFIMLVLPASHSVDFEKVKKILGKKQVKLAEENDLEKLFPDVEVGAEPPLGNLYNIRTVVDETLTKDPEIVFQAGTHVETVKIQYNDYARLVKPEIASFAVHLH